MKGWEGQAGEYGVVWTLGREHSDGRKMANWSQWLQKGGHNKDQTQPNSLSLGALPAAGLLVLSDLVTTAPVLSQPCPHTVSICPLIVLTLYHPCLSLLCPCQSPYCPCLSPHCPCIFAVPPNPCPVFSTVPPCPLPYLCLCPHCLLPVSLPVPSLSLPSPAVLDLENRWLNLILGSPRGPLLFPVVQIFYFFYFF